jgi:hypothetical protein
VYRQFELSKENRDEGVIWYVLGIVLPPFLLVYAWVMVSNVRYVRERMRLRPGVGPLAFVTLVTLGFGVYFVASLVAVVGGFSERAALQALGVAALAFLATVPVAYWILQRDINELWAAYDSRMRELTPAPAAALPPAAPLPAPFPPAAGLPAPSYFADSPPPRPPPE